MLQKIHSRAWPILRSALLDERELRRIPASGAVVLLLNRYPERVEMGRLATWFRERRPDLAIAGFAEKQTDSYGADIVPSKDNNIWSVEILEDPEIATKHLRNGGVLVIFPRQKEIPWPVPVWIPRRGPWKNKWLRLILLNSAPVVPVYLQEAGPSQPFRVRIGNPVSTGHLSGFDETRRLERHLSARLFSLGCVSGETVAPEHSPWLRVIHTPFDQQTLAREIIALSPENKLLEQGSFAVYEAGAEQIPHVLHEIGRLREVTFQAAGEGSARMIDLDEFDAHYRHLFAWDHERQQLAGAYRLGPGDRILESFGKHGFYLHSLFHLKDGLVPMLSQSLELGRSFVAPKYQQQRLPLFLLWKGVTAFVNRNPQYRWLIGPVSISNNYSAISRSVMVRYIQAHHFDPEMAALVKPRKAFKPDFGGLDADALLAGINADPRTLDALIADIEPAHFRLPVLLKKYFAQNARIIGFNVDPSFSNALDGFMVCRTADLSATYR